MGISGDEAQQIIIACPGWFLLQGVSLRAYLTIANCKSNQSWLDHCRSIVNEWYVQLYVSYIPVFLISYRDGQVKRISSQIETSCTLALFFCNDVIDWKKEPFFFFNLKASIETWVIALTIIHSRQLVRLAKWRCRHLWYRGNMLRRSTEEKSQRGEKRNNATCITHKNSVKIA